MFLKSQRFKSQNGVLVDEKAQLFYLNILIFNKKMGPIHGMFLLGIKETSPLMYVKMYCIVFFKYKMSKVFRCG